MFQQHSRTHWIILLGLCLVLLAAPVLAQEGLPQPVSIRSTTPGEVTLLFPVARFVLSTPREETVSLQIAGIGARFTPRVRILDTASRVVFEVTATGSTLSEEIDLSPGGYIIEVMSQDGSAGQFVLLLAPFEPVELVAGQPVRATVTAESRLRYRFSDTGLAGETLLIEGDTPGAGPAYRIIDATTGRELISNDGMFPSVVFTLRGTGTDYLIEISSEGVTPNLRFTVCLGCTQSVPTPTPAPTATEPPPTETATPVVCNVVSTSAGNAYVRGGPDFNFNAVGILRAGQSARATAQTASGGWYQVDLDGVLGWVGSSIARLDGDCADLPTLAGG
jgi:hypothetical protein